MHDDLDDILERAIAAEEASAALYRQAAERAQDQHARAFLLELAGTEDEHSDKLRALEVEGLAASGDDAPRRELGYAAFLKPLEITPDASLRTLLTVAAQREHAAFEFYRRLAEASDDPQARATFNALAAEESAHRQRFEAELDDLERMAEQ